jgi:hypothetical protein
VGCAVQALTARLNGGAFNTYLFFFGVWCTLIGILIYRSTFLPRILGVLVGISGLGWMRYLVPPVATHLFSPYIVVASAIGELPLQLWLIVMAVNADKWKETSFGDTARYSTV